MGRRAIGLAILLYMGAVSSAVAQDAGTPETVQFLSGDGRTALTGYLFRTPARQGERRPGIVMMHGRAGAYSQRANGRYDATTLTLRHKAWGRRWAEAGYVAVLVDGFGPRGHPAGFPRFSYENRPGEVDETTVRPRDAYGALAYLRTRPDVISDRIGLQGWSNGGSAAIVAISTIAPGVAGATPATGFRAALSFYPACGLKKLFDETPFKPYAPTLVLHGSADEEVSATRCEALVTRSRAAGGDVEITVYPGAVHGFDAPDRSRQAVEANAAATEAAIARSLAFFARHVRGDR